MATPGFRAPPRPPAPFTMSVVEPMVKLAKPDTLPENPRLREPSYKFSVHCEEVDDERVFGSFMSNTARRPTYANLEVIKEDKNE